MSMSKGRVFALIACLLIGGCAGAPAKYHGLADSVGHENLDVLFATEFPVSSKEEAIAKSRIAYRDGKLDKALFYSVQALRFDETDVELLARIAHLHVLQGNRALAARAFNMALAREPGHPMSLQGLGLLYFKAGDAGQAREKLELAVAGDPRLWQSWNVLGILADGRGKHDLAAGCYDRALEINPGSFGARLNQGYSRYLAGDLSTAARLLFQLAEETDHPQAWRNVGLIYAELGWYEEALDIFRRVEGEASAYNSTGAIALENDDFQVARSYLEQAVRHSPVYFAEAERNLATVRRQLGD